MPRWAQPVDLAAARLVAYKLMTGTRFRTIADELRERIALGELGDSGALESEAALGARYGASRVTVRRALELLRDAGPGREPAGPGWFVTGAVVPRRRWRSGTFRHATSAVADAGQSGLPARWSTFGYQAPPVAAAPPASTWPTGSEVLRSRSVRTVDGVAARPRPRVGARPPSPARSAAPTPTEPGIWETLQRAGPPGRLRAPDASPPASPTDDDAALLEVARRHPAAADPPAGARRRRHADRPVRPPLPGPPVQPGGRVQRLAAGRRRSRVRPACAPSLPALPDDRRIDPPKETTHEGPRHRRRRLHRRELRPPRPRRPARLADHRPGRADLRRATARTWPTVGDQIEFVARQRRRRRAGRHARGRHRRGRALRRRVAQRQLPGQPVAVHGVQHHRHLPPARGGAPPRRAAAPHLHRRGLRRPRARRPGPVHRADPGQPVEPLLGEQGERRPAGAGVDPLVRHRGHAVQLLQQLRALPARREVHPPPDHRHPAGHQAQAVRRRRQRARLDPRRRPQRRGHHDPRAGPARRDLPDRRRRRAEQPPRSSRCCWS